MSTAANPPIRHYLSAHSRMLALLFIGLAVTEVRSKLHAAEDTPLAAPSSCSQKWLTLCSQLRPDDMLGRYKIFWAI
jgi:hypothetical protein